MGEVATQTIRQQRKLVGIDVILVHRMLKNPVEIPEYVLLSDDLHALGDGLAPGQEVSQELEGIGPSRAWFVDVEDLPGPTATPAPRPWLLSRLGRTAVVAGSGMPYMIGLRRRRAAAGV